MSLLENLFHVPVTEDLLVDEVVIIIDASDIPIVINEIEQKTAESAELLDAVEPLMESHKALTLALNNGDRDSAYTHGQSYDIIASELRTKLGLASHSKLSVESMTMSELWLYSTEEADSLFEKIKLAVDKFVKWVLEKIKSITASIKGWLDKALNGDVAESLKKSTKISFDGVTIKGETYTHLGPKKPFSSSGEIKSSFNQLKDIFKVYDAYVKKVVEVLGKTEGDVLESASVSTVDSLRKEISDLADQYARKDVVMGFTFQKNADNKIEWVFNKDGANPEDYAEYTLDIKKDDLVGVVETSKSIAELGKSISKSLEALEKKIKAAGDHLATLSNDANLEDKRKLSTAYSKLRESMSITGSTVSSLLSVISLFTKADNYWSGLAAKLAEGKSISSEKKEDK